MARRHGRRHKQSFKIPILSLAILGGQALLAKERGGDLAGAVQQFQQFYTGFDLNQGIFVPSYLAIGWAPWLAKGLVSKVARPMGARPKIPFGLPISIS